MSISNLEARLAHLISGSFRHSRSVRTHDRTGDFGMVMRDVWQDCSGGKVMCTSINGSIDKLQSDKRIRVEAVAMINGLSGLSQDQAAYSASQRGLAEFA